MIDLFQERPGEIHVFLRRRPNRDGGSPNSNRLAIAVAGLFLMGFAAVYLGPGILREPRGIALFAVVCGWAVLCVLSQFEKVIFDARRRKIYRALFFLRIRVADFDDFREIRIRIQEEKGRVLGGYVGLWKSDILRPPLRLTPRGSSGQMSHFRHTLLPRMRRMVFGEEEEAAGWIASAPRPKTAGEATGGRKTVRTSSGFSSGRPGRSRSR